MAIGDLVLLQYLTTAGVKRRLFIPFKEVDAWIRAYTTGNRFHATVKGTHYFVDTAEIVDAQLGPDGVAYYLHPTGAKGTYPLFEETAKFGHETSEPLEVQAVGGGEKLILDNPTPSEDERDENLVSEDETTASEDESIEEPVHANGVSSTTVSDTSTPFNSDLVRAYEKPKVLKTSSTFHTDNKYAGIRYVYVGAGPYKYRVTCQCGYMDTTVSDYYQGRTGCPVDGCGRPLFVDLEVNISVREETGHDFTYLNLTNTKRVNFKQFKGSVYRRI